MRYVESCLHWAYKTDLRRRKVESLPDGACDHHDTVDIWDVINKVADELEVQIVRHLEAGYTMLEIGLILNIAPATVHDRIDSLRKRLENEL